MPDNTPATSMEDARASMLNEIETVTNTDDGRSLGGSTPAQEGVASPALPAGAAPDSEASGLEPETGEAGDGQTKTGDRDAGEDDAKPKDQKTAKPSRAAVRVEEALRERAAMSRLAERALKRAAEAEAALQEFQRQQPQQYTDAEQYMRALARSEALQREVESASRDVSRHDSEILEASKAAFTAACEAAQARLPDLKEVFSRTEIADQITVYMTHAMIDEGAVAPFIAHHLITNPAELQRIASYDPIGQAKAIARLAVRFEAALKEPATAPAAQGQATPAISTPAVQQPAPQPRLTQAPAPVKSVASRSPGRPRDRAALTDDMDAYAEAWKRAKAAAY